MAHIKSIIWDFGNILGRFDHFKACKNFAMYCEITPEEILKKLFSGENAPVKLHESGKCSSQEFFRLVREILSFSDDLSFRMFSDIWKDIFQENDGISTIIDSIPPNISQCILSNTDPIHWSAIEKIPVMKKHFSDQTLLVRSYTSGKRKPDIRIYHDALRCLKLTKEEIQHVLYVDDIAEYRVTFERMGGNTLPYDCSKDNLLQLEDGLRKFGIL